MSDDAPAESGPLRLIGLFAGPLAAFAVFLALHRAGGGASNANAFGLSDQAVCVAAVAALMAVWWLSEAIPLAATAMLPLALFPILRIMPIADTGRAFGNEIVFLFLGGFLIQLAMERWHLHKRIALAITIFVGTSPRRLVGGLMLATAFISMWISNAAAAAMMLPIAVSVCGVVARREGGPGIDTPLSPGAPRAVRNFGAASAIGVAWAATIGGLATPIGTAPNVLMRGFLKEQFQRDISFGKWMLLCAPLSCILLIAAWWLLTVVFFPVRSERDIGETDSLRADLRALGPISRGEWSTLVVFLCAVTGWLFSKDLSHLLGLVRTLPNGKPQELLNDSVVAMTAGLSLFIIPVNLKNHVFALDWRDAKRLSYGTLLLFGGGLALADAISASGLDLAIGHAVSGLGGLPPLALVITVCALVVFLSEFVSNTALTATLLPIMASAATAMKLDPTTMLLTTALAASAAFMMPAGTPPSAITFSSGYYRIGDMAKAGLALNLIGVLLIGAAIHFIGPIVLG